LSFFPILLTAFFYPFFVCVVTTLSSNLTIQKLQIKIEEILLQQKVTA